MKFDLMTGGLPLTKMQALARDAEAAGFTGLVITEAGRTAYLAGRPPEREDAEASSPLTGFLEKLHTSQADPGVTA